jgi:hypothetical protein
MSSATPPAARAQNAHPGAARGGPPAERDCRADRILAPTITR